MLGEGESHHQRIGSGLSVNSVQGKKIKKANLLVKNLLAFYLVAGAGLEPATFGL